MATAKAEGITWLINNRFSHKPLCLEDAEYRCRGLNIHVYIDMPQATAIQVGFGYTTYLMGKVRFGPQLDSSPASALLAVMVSSPPVKLGMAAIFNFAEKCPFSSQKTLAS
jgi:hypothetical protein